MSNLTLFLVQWGLTSLSLWVASYIFSGLRFADGGSLIIAALLLGFANAICQAITHFVHATAHRSDYGLVLASHQCFGAYAGLCRG